MAFNKYYQDELAYLRDLGQEFSHANPKLAPFLGQSGNDPDVERLLEGFAFLAGRLRQKLDDELPELAHSVIALLWPHYLRPQPSLSVLEFQPIANAVTERKRIPRGTEVDSVPVDGTACRFRTCCDVDLLPLRLEKAELQRTGAGSQLRLGFATTAGASLDRLGLDRLRLHLAGDAFVSKSLYLWLCRYVERVVMRGAEGDEFHLPPECIKPAGFGEEEGLLPYPPNAFLGYRLLQEYFALPEKFLSLDIGGLKPVARLKTDTAFDLVFELSRPMDEQVRPRKDNFRLFCTPIVNLFARDADPIRVDQTTMEYRVRPSGKEATHYEIYSVDRVEGWAQGTGKKRAYPAFESFDHVAEERNAGGATYYRTRIHPAVVGRGAETYISFVNAADGRVVPPTETVSLWLTCSNRNLPAKLRAGDVSTPTGSSPDFARFANITAPRPSVMPPLDAGLQWQLISNMALNYVSLAQVDALRVVLSAYDFLAFHDRQAERESNLRLKGIVSARVEPVDTLHHGLPVRGLRTRIEMQESNFAGEGDMYLLASVLNEFFALYASINSTHQLVVRGTEHGEVYEWTPRIGQQPLL